MFPDEVFKRKVIDRGFALAIFLYDHPNLVVREYERGEYTYYRYDADSDRIMYRRPSNKRFNDWQIAYGLEGYMRSHFMCEEEI